MHTLFSFVSALFEKVTGKKLFYVSQRSTGRLGKTAAWSDFGFWYVGDVYDTADIAYGIAQNGVVEKEDTDLVVRILGEIRDPVVYDIGANTGYYGILAATQFGATVHSFEPIPAHVSCIRESARINGVSEEVFTHTVALGRTKAMCALNLAGSGSTLTKDFLGDTTTPTIDVSVETLDSFHIDPPHFIKIDVEGYEWEVLQGAQETIVRHKPICFIEIAHHFTARNFLHPHFADIINFFHTHEYTVERNTAAGLVNIESIPDGVAMYLCTPNK